MNNLWILSEERPKIRVVEIIIEDILKYNIEYKESDKIVPVMINGAFSFSYKVNGMKVTGFDNVFICIVKGESSFVDYMIFEKEEKPDATDIPIALIEETKTVDAESRNVHAFQRNIKFAYASIFYPNARKVMLYTNEIKSLKSKPTETNIFGTNILLTLGVEIYGKNIDIDCYSMFNSIDELITAKNNMKPPTSGKPIKMIETDEAIYITAKLDKRKRNIQTQNLS